MELSTFPQTASPAPVGSAANTPAKAGSILSSDFETFLKMLTTQARYQDPLEPIDSSEYAAQLAQFSMVEQQVQSNDLLTALSAQLSSGNMAQAASWIGMEARTTEAVQFTGEPITIASNPAIGADDVRLVVYDEFGAEVQRMALPLTATQIDWAGFDAQNAPFASGLYTFKVESYAAGEMLGSVPAEAYGKVTEARTQDGKSLLILEGGSEISADSITALRAPRS
jgi:flagellar basal-body rod modification protein FlgD